MAASILVYDIFINQIGVSTMFGINDPANNIITLLNYLNNTHSDSYVYRGQEKDYDSLLPSFYRNKTANVRFNKNTNSFQFAYNKYNLFIQYNEEKDSLRNKYKRFIMNHLMSKFGKSLGNVISQQYGIFSECLDVTSSPQVAAFFATHSYPNYQQVLQSKDLGVIYRIEYKNSSNFNLQYSGTELMLSSSYLIEDPNPIPLLFSSYKHQINEEEIEKINNKYSLELKNTCTHPIIMNNKDLEKLFLTFSDDTINGLDIVACYKESRIFKQQAGFIVPSFMNKSLIPKDRSIEEMHNIKVYKPGFAIHTEKVGIEDILAYPKIEKFYFYHDNTIKSIYTREELWPNKSDTFFNFLYTICNDLCNKYLNDFNIEVDDLEKGILDRGFY